MGEVTEVSIPLEVTYEESLEEIWVKMFAQISIDSQKLIHHLETFDFLMIYLDKIYKLAHLHDDEMIIS